MQHRLERRNWKGDHLFFSSPVFCLSLYIIVQEAILPREMKSLLCRVIKIQEESEHNVKVLSASEVTGNAEYAQGQT